MLHFKRVMHKRRASVSIAMIILSSNSWDPQMCFSSLSFTNWIQLKLVTDPWSQTSDCCTNWMQWTMYTSSFHLWCYSRSWNANFRLLVGRGKVKGCIYDQESLGENSFAFALRASKVESSRLYKISNLDEHALHPQLPRTRSANECRMATFSGDLAYDIH